MHFPSTVLGYEGTAEPKSPELVTVNHCYPDQAGAQPANGVWQDSGARQGSGGHLKSNAGEPWQHSARSQQRPSRADVQGSCEFQKLLALRVFAANKDGNGKRYALVFPPFCERSSLGHARSWE